MATDPFQDVNTDDTSSTTSKRASKSADDSAKAATPTQDSKATKAKRKAETVLDKDGNEIPVLKAPRSHASDAVSRNAVVARENEVKRADPGKLAAADPVDLSQAKYIAMPPGGLAALADSLFADDLDDQEKMDAHIRDLQVMNRDVLRDDTSHRVGQLVRIS